MYVDVHVAVSVQTACSVACLPILHAAVVIVRAQLHDFCAFTPLLCTVKRTFVLSFCVVSLI